MPCALAPLVVAAALSGPMCPRADRPAAPMADVLAALRGDARVELATNDPAFEAAIRAIRQKPVPSPRRKRRR